MKINPFVILYQFLIAWPVLIVITILVAISTIILSPLIPNSKLAYFPARCWGRVICYFMCIRVNLVGLENIRANQSCIIVANHQSMFDIFVVYGWFPNIFKWIMKAELRKIPLVGKACESAGHIFLDRRSPLAAKASLNKAQEQLKNGVSVLIFPEGTRTRTGEMGSFKKGAFKLASDLSLPIMPVTIKGSFERMKRGAFWVNPGVITLIFHEVIEQETYQANNTQELMMHTWQIIHSELDH